MHPKKFKNNGDIFITSDDVRIEEVTYCKSGVSSPDSVPDDPTTVDNRINVVVKAFTEQSSANEFRLFFNEFKILKLIKDKEEKDKEEDKDDWRDLLIEYIGYVHFKDAHRPLSIALVFKLEKYINLYEYSSEINEPHKEFWEKLSQGKIKNTVRMELYSQLFQLKSEWQNEIMALYYIAFDIARGRIYKFT